jgi:putative hydrolase of HD superfamily
MYRMSILSMLAPPSLAARIDIPHCTKMALIHDVAESLVGDITPVDNVPKSEKARRESLTMDYLTQTLLGGGEHATAANDMRKIWAEYEDSETLEAKFVHDLDKIELVLQTVEYERKYECNKDLSDFMWVAERVVLPEMKEWVAELAQEREALWKAYGKTPKGLPKTTSEIKQVDVNGSGNEAAAAERVRMLEEYYGKNQ